MDQKNNSNNEQIILQESFLTPRGEEERKSQEEADKNKSNKTK